MTREELIRELSKASLAAVPTSATLDGGLAYEYIMPEGAGQGSGGMGSWPAYKIRSIGKAQWEMIRYRIYTNAVTENDFCNTDFQYLLGNLHAIYREEFGKYYGNLAEAFAGLLHLPEETGDYIYCLWDLSTWGEYPKFYLQEEDLLAAFREKYCGTVTQWEDMGDEELEMWMGKAREDLAEFTYIFF